jgi:hypothetical protein
METGIRPMGRLPTPRNAPVSPIRQSDLILQRAGGLNTAEMQPMPYSATRLRVEASFIASFAQITKSPHPNWDAGFERRSEGFGDQ